MSINSNDPLKPNLIWAKDYGMPVGRVLLLAEPETVRTWAESFGSEAKMGEYAGLVHGVIVGDEGEKRQLSNGLLAPKAIFRGLKRPLYNHSLDADKSVYIYISDHRFTYRYPLRNKFSGGPLERLDAPFNSVFAAYVSFELGHIDVESAGMAEGTKPKGLVVGWEWLEESGKVSGLPYDYDSRFDARVM